MQAFLPVHQTGPASATTHLILVRPASAMRCATRRLRASPPLAARAPPRTQPTTPIPWRASY